MIFYLEIGENYSYLSCTIKRKKMTTTTPDFKNICSFFKCTMEQLHTQYVANAAGLKNMHNKAIETGKKVNGYTEAQLEAMVEKYNTLASQTQGGKS
jgi:hypothetical protein